MTDYKEEQANELEALESIYPDELQIIEMEPYPSFQMMVTTQSMDNSDDTSATIIMQFTYTEKYPDEVPIIEITGSDNLEEDQVERLTQMMKELAEENLGMVMIFTLVSAAIEKMGEMLDESVKQQAEEAERRLQEKEEAERVKFEGHRVTIESFLAWKAKFDAEMAELKKKKGKTVDVSNKPTGKELFMKDATLDDSDVKFLQEEGESVEVDESLFQDMEDLDIELEDELS